MEKGSKMADIAKKDTLRDKLHTANNIIKQLKHEAEVKERCYQTVMKQRNEAEVKVTMLVSLIDEVLWPKDKDLQAIVKEEMQRLDV